MLHMGPYKQTSNQVQDYSQPNPGWRPSRGSYSSRGFRGGRGQIHRNRTLVLNGNSPVTPSDLANPKSDKSENIIPNSATSGWVTKTDRHLQLINTSVFGKESQNRAKAIEETRKQKLKQRDERERLKFNRHLQRANGSSALSEISPRPGKQPGNYEINVNGIQFQVAKSGSKLIKVPGETLHKPGAGVELHAHVEHLSLHYPGDLNAARATPKTAMIGGIKFHRSKNGNMFRSGMIKASR